MALLAALLSSVAAVAAGGTLLVTDHAVQLQLVSPLNHNVHVVERLVIEAPFPRADAPGGQGIRMNRVVDAGGSRTCSHSAAHPASSRLADIHVRFMTDDGVRISLPVDALDTAAADCQVVLSFTMPVPGPMLPRVLLELTYMLGDATYVRRHNHGFFPTYDTVMDWTVSPVSPSTHKLDVSVWSPRAVPPEDGHRVISWMPPWPWSAGVFDSVAQAVRGRNRGSMPANTFATAQAFRAVPLDIKTVYDRAGVIVGTLSKVRLGEEPVAAATAHPLPDGIVDVPQVAPAWVRLRVSVSSVTWKPTHDIVADLDPTLDIFGSMQLPGMAPPVDDADPPASDYQSVEADVTNLLGYGALPPPTSGGATRVAVSSSEAHPESTWCWAMYKHEPGLLNCPWFLISPVLYSGSWLTPPEAPDVVATLTGLIGVLLSIVFVGHMWLCALVPSSVLRNGSAPPLLLGFASFAHPVVASCYGPVLSHARSNPSLEDADQAAAAFVRATQQHYSQVSPSLRPRKSSGNVPSFALPETVEEGGESTTPTPPSTSDDDDAGEAPLSHMPPPLSLYDPEAPPGASVVTPSSPQPATLDTWVFPASTRPRSVLQRFFRAVTTAVTFVIVFTSCASRCQAVSRVVRSCCRHKPLPPEAGTGAAPSRRAHCRVCATSSSTAAVLSRILPVFAVGILLWAFWCMQSVVPVCGLALGRGCPWRSEYWWAHLCVSVVLGPLPTCIVTIRYWHVALFSPPGGLLRRYVMDKIGRVLVISTGGFTLLLTWISAVLMAATGVLHWSTMLFAITVVFNSLVTLWFLLGHNRLVSRALRVCQDRSVCSGLCLLVCVVLLAEPLVAAAVASYSPGTLSLVTFLKLQTGLGALLGLLSRSVKVFGKIVRRADEFEEAQRERAKQCRGRRFASI